MMILPQKYKCLNQNTFTKSDFSILPLRYEDRFDIMDWRNEQLYHLRQDKPLTRDEQELYFTKVVYHLFDQNHPPQILFSYIEGSRCIGYGGLVHINWKDKNAEISFIMKTSLEKKFFHFHWKTYLDLIEKVAFGELGLHKIYTFAFDLRPQLYEAIEASEYTKEAILREHCSFGGDFKDVVIHSKISPYFVRKIQIDDIAISYEWANDIDTRINSFDSNSIKFDDHKIWFETKLSCSDSDYYMCYFEQKKSGLIRFDINNECSLIGINIAPQFRGMGLSRIFLNLCIKEHIQNYDFIEFVAFIKPQNVPSIKVFENLGFTRDSDVILNNQKALKYKKNRNE